MAEKCNFFFNYTKFCEKNVIIVLDIYAQLHGTKINQFGLRINCSRHIRKVFCYWILLLMKTKLKYFKVEIGIRVLRLIFVILITILKSNSLIYKYIYNAR